MYLIIFCSAARKYFCVGSAHPPNGDEKPIGVGCLDIARTDLQALLVGLAAKTRSCAHNALNDLDGLSHCTFDPEINRAYCFQRKGHDFYYQFWSTVRNQSVADTLFAEIPQTDLPIDPSLAAQIYCGATAPTASMFGLSTNT